MLFTKEFLAKLHDQCGSKTMMNFYESQGMSFKESILKLANLYLIEPEYIGRTSRIYKRGKYIMERYPTYEEREKIKEEGWEKISNAKTANEKAHYFFA